MLLSYDKALASNPSDAKAWLNRGVALDYLGRYEESVASYDKALALQPNFSAAQENRDLALSKQERLIPTIIGAMIFLRDHCSRFSALAQKTPAKTVPVLENRPAGPDQIIVEEKRPKEKKLGYGTIPEESELHTLASLCAIINMHGRSILDEPEKVAELLNELSQGDYEKERNALLAALKDNVPQELSKPQKGFTWVSTSSRLKKQLKENHGMPDELADWVIETWAKALEMEL